MSTDDTDASDMMSSSGGGSNSAEVTYGDLGIDQQKKYQTLVQRGARYVRDGVMTIEDCSLGQILTDGQEASGALVDAFHGEIEDTLDDLDDSAAERRQEKREKRKRATTDPTKIDWEEVWAECNVTPHKPLSGTQLALAIDVSEQTPVTDKGAAKLIDGAVEAGVLQEYPEKSRYAPPVEGGE